MIDWLSAMVRAYALADSREVLYTWRGLMERTRLEWGDDGYGE